MKFDWKEEGFARAPELRVTTGQENLYRAWGGDPRRKWGNIERPGVCFSMDRASSRWHAELLYSIMEYGNSALFLTHFSIPAGLPVWVGQVDPGDPRALLGAISGTQVYVERRYVVLVCEVATHPLRDDMSGRVVLPPASSVLPS